MSACPTDCGGAVKPGNLMCLCCWRLVPKPLQSEVMRTWRAYQFYLRGAKRRRELKSARADTGVEYHKARDAAIASARERLIKQELRA